MRVSVTKDTHTRQDAVFESGLDNSPLYDSNSSYWDPSTSKLQIYDVGQTAYFLSEADSLAELAGVLGRTSDVTMLRSRITTMQDHLNKHLWDNTRKIYANKVATTGDFVASLAPTSFFPMISGSATVEQVR